MKVILEQEDWRIVQENYRRPNPHDDPSSRYTIEYKYIGEWVTVVWRSKRTEMLSYILTGTGPNLEIPEHIHRLYRWLTV